MAGAIKSVQGTVKQCTGYTFLYLLVFCFLNAGEETAYRIDENQDESLEWFQLQGNEYPPPNSAHYIGGELMNLDYQDRSFVVRADRTDDHRRSHFDLPLGAKMLPYGSIYLHGAPAALEDIPLGTHLNGHFYLKDPDDKSEPIEAFHGRITPEVDFNRCFRLEDDFSYYQRQGKIWQIESVDLVEMKMTALLTPAEEGGKAEEFDIQKSTRIWEGSGFTHDLTKLEKGQKIQFNLTWATLYGPGRIEEIWLDEQSRKLASEHQRRKHIIYIQQRGLAGRVDAVDNHERILTIDFFGGVDESLFESLKVGDSAGVAVARKSLITYDPVNDRKRGPILEIIKGEPQPGGSGVKIKVKPDLLLEGYRPGEIVRVYPGSWPVIALPLEERYFGRY